MRHREILLVYPGSDPHAQGPEIARDPGRSLPMGALSLAAALEGACRPGVVRLRGVVREVGEGGGRAGLAVEAAAGREGSWRAAGGRVLLVGRAAWPWREGLVVAVEGTVPPVLQRRNPGEASERLALLRRGYGCVLAVRGAVVLARRGGGGAAAWPEAVRRWLERAAFPTVGREIFPLYASVVLGDRRLLGGDLAADFRASGLAHLLAVSGLHVTLLAGTAEAALAFAGVGGAGRAAAVGLLVAAYAAVTGGSPPVVRAAIASLALLAARSLGRQAGGMGLLALAFLLELMWRPFDLFDPGFQLSYAATAGIVLWARPWGEALGRWLPRGWGSGLLGTTLAAQAATLPFVAHHFGTVPLWGPLANLAAVPLAEVALPAGLLGCLAGGVSPAFGWLVNRVTEASLAGVAAVAAFVADLPGATPVVPPPAAGAALAALACLMVGLSPRPEPEPAAAWGWRVMGWWDTPAAEPGTRASGRRGTAGAVAWCGLAVLFLLPLGPVLRHRLLSWPVEVVFLDVGQGDAVVVWLRRGVLVVDGGRWRDRVADSRRSGEGEGRAPRATGDIKGCPADAASPAAGGGGRLVAYLRREGVRRVDRLVVTHADADHAGGSLAVLRCFGVGEVWTGGPAEDTDLAASLAEAVRRSGARVRAPRRGEEVPLAPGVAVQVLNPPPRLLTGTRADENNNSLVLRLRAGDRFFLLAADLEAEGEADLLGAGMRLAADVLKVAHHGSRSSSTGRFLAAVKPWVAVVQVGRNPYGMPDAGVLRRITAGGATVWRTDRGGAVTVLTDGRRLLVRDMAGRRAEAALR